MADLHTPFGSLRLSEGQHLARQEHRKNGL